MTDVDSVNFFKDRDVVADPYPYLEALHTRCPVSKEPHHNVWMVTGWEECTEVAGDADRFSSCIAVTGPFPGDRKSTRLNSSHIQKSRMPSSA